jgi:hypothetical protein
VVAAGSEHSLHHRDEEAPVAGDRLNGQHGPEIRFRCIAGEVEAEVDNPGLGIDHAAFFPWRQGELRCLCDVMVNVVLIDSLYRLSWAMATLGTRRTSFAANRAR